MNQTPLRATQGEPDAATSRKSGSAGGGEETTDRKIETGASPPTQRLAMTESMTAPSRKEQYVEVRGRPSQRVLFA